MFKAILLAMMMVTVSSAGIGGSAQAKSLDLSRFLWKNRLLFLFAPNRNHPFFDTLHKSLTAQQAEVADRDLVLIEILESGPSTMNATHLDPQIAQSLREEFDVPRGEFSVILIGKDGGIKLNRQDQTQIIEIFNLIDSMPMRQKEMRQKVQ